MTYIKGRFILPHPPILVPEVGKEQARLGQKTLDGYAEVGKSIQKAAPKNIIIISPHAQGFRDKFYINHFPRISGDLSQFGHREILLGFDNNPPLAKAISEKAKTLGINAGGVDASMMRHFGFTYALDHGIVVPLYFINHFYENYRLIPISLSSLSPKEHYLMGKAIALSIEDSKEDTIVIASGDLSHKLKADGPYGFAEEGVLFDETIKRCLAENDTLGLLEIDCVLEEKAAQCGLYGFWVLLGTLDGYSMNAKVHSYEAPFGVGYLTATIEANEKTEDTPLETYLAHRKEALKEIREKESPPLALARMSLAHYLDTNQEMSVPDDFPEEWTKEQGGTFVSFHKNGELRGCIGTIGATQKNLAEEIINNAIAAGTHDYRFPPISPGEIKDLTISVDVLGKIEEVGSEKELDPKIYGVIVQSGGKRGLLLPNLEGVATVEEQIRIAREKAGIPFYKKITLQKFKVTRYE